MKSPKDSKNRETTYSFDKLFVSNGFTAIAYLESVRKRKLNIHFTWRRQEKDISLSPSLSWEHWNVYMPAFWLVMFDPILNATLLMKANNVSRLIDWLILGWIS